MTKSEIEKEIIKELSLVIPDMGKLPGDKGLVLLQKESWRIADKYDTDGANVINILFSHFDEIMKS